MGEARRPVNGYARLEQQGQGLTESLSDAGAIRDRQGRTAAEPCWRGCGRRWSRVAASREQEEEVPEAGWKRQSHSGRAGEEPNSALGQEYGSGAGEGGRVQSKLKDQISQTQVWEQRNAETNQARAVLEVVLKSARRARRRTTRIKSHVGFRLTRIGESLAQPHQWRRKNQPGSTRWSTYQLQIAAAGNWLSVLARKRSCTS